jgi:hypothetical protein
LRKKLKEDFPLYAATCLKIRTKSGAIEPFVLNRAQLFLHNIAEQQKRETGRVRLVCVKGRQQGISTYWQARTYHAITHARGREAFILTHEQDATDNLFSMTERFHKTVHPWFKPHTSASNAKALKFDQLDSGYTVATAGSKGAGRSKTIHLFHGSEVAYWPHAQTHIGGVMQAIPGFDDTEVLLESTANGPGDVFHGFWQGAIAGRSEYRAVFVPWYWQDEYQRDPEGLELSDEDRLYMAANDLTMPQMAWRAHKITEFNGDAGQFKREYPANPDEAFEASAEQSFIRPELVQIARRAKPDAIGPRLLGVDPARFGDDKTAIVERQGRVVHPVETFAKRDTMEVAGLVKQRLDAGIDFAFIDVVGVGAGVVDRLREMGYAAQVIPVNAGESALDEGKYFNKRAEMYGVLREWLKEQPAQLPDDDAVQADLCVTQYKYTSNSQYKLESKDDLKKRLGRSPDRGDAIALTFAEPVAGRSMDISRYKRAHARSGGGSWMG